MDDRVPGTKIVDSKRIRPLVSLVMNFASPTETTLRC